MHQPIAFEPILMERVWGGRELEKRFFKKLPGTGPYGESWELVDREEAQSVAVGGEWDAHTLHDLWANHREGIFGEPYGSHSAERFPMLIKLLDAREKLSLQVHPPVEKAWEMDGEPKTEMWFFLDCDPGAKIYAGVRKGVDREAFRRMIEEGRAEEGTIELPVSKGQSIFIPSGRMHAIGGGNLIAEIQQNSDTTYRVFDWNRVGLDGNPRQLHIEESLASIDFNDHGPEPHPGHHGQLAHCPYFEVHKIRGANAIPASIEERFTILGGISGTLRVGGRELQPGGFLLIPAGFSGHVEQHGDHCEVLQINLPLEGAAE